MKLFVKALPIAGDCFKYVNLAIPSQLSEKMKAAVFDGSQIRQLFKYDHFFGIMSEIENNAWLVFKNIVKDFLGNIGAPSYVEIVQQLL